MADQLSPQPAPTPAPLGPDLAPLRGEIDAIDQQILALVNRRAVLATEVGRVKSLQKAEVFNPAREEEVIGKLLGRNAGPMPDASLRAIYREIISASRALQRPMQVAFLGPEYTFSHLAALMRFGEAVEYLGVASIAAIFEEVQRKHVHYGVVPIENSTDGRVVDTLEMFIRMPGIRICSEVRLRVQHNLLAACEADEIRAVYSKPQALSQCRNWLAKNLPNARLKEVASTADAARLAKTELGAAAIASREAGVRHGVPLLFADIEDSAHNETRFAVIGFTACQKTGRDKTAIMFQIPHKAGSLYRTLGLFEDAGVNLTWIESFPLRELKGEYTFFVECDGHESEPHVGRAVAALELQCDALTVLGSFPAAPAAE